MHQRNTEEDSSFVRTVTCHKCGSRSGGAEYTDHFFCFSCEHHEFFTEGEKVESKPSNKELIRSNDYRDLLSRKIRQDTCRHFKYSYYKDSKGEVFYVANYYKEGELVAQKLRGKDKNFFAKGSMKGVGLFGQQLWKPEGKMVVVTEGEIDAMSVSQLQSNKYPVVSLPNGASSAKKSIKDNLQWLESFDSIILMFDMDDPGQEAAKGVAPLFSPGKCKIARLPLKDANECLKAGKGEAVISAIWNAIPYKPDGVLGVMDAYEEAIRKPVNGIPFPWPTLNKTIFGIQRKCSYYLGAGVGVGKTNWAKELQSWLVNEQGLPVGVFMLEESVGRTLKGIAGKFAGIPFHRPDADYTQEQLEQAIKDLDGKVFLYNHAVLGADWDSVKKAIRYMVVSLGVKDIFLDNLTVLVAHLNSGEANDEVNRIAKEIKEMLQELDFTLYGFSHLNTPTTGKPHERGGKVLVSQFTGSRGLMRFGNYMLGIERDLDPELDEDDRNISTLVLLKDREYGEVCEFDIRYDPETDKYRELNEAEEAFE